MEINKLKNIVVQFLIEGEIIDIKPLNGGFINDTFIVYTSKDYSNYILQRKNHIIFSNIPAMMDNIKKVTTHLKQQVINRGGNPQREVLTVIETINNDLYYRDIDGNYWTMCIYIDNSITFDKADSLDLCYKGGTGMGQFQSDLSNFEDTLTETIKGFHNIRWRYKQWNEILLQDKYNRKKDLNQEINWIESRIHNMLKYWEKVESGEIPIKVTHNDTKLSNILFDENQNVLCIIDLDTVMNSTSLNDFGDAIRSYTNTSSEDDPILDNISMDLEKFKAYTAGYLFARKTTLIQKEIDWLAFSALYITYEQVLRFLMDHINGDVYYKTSYPNHNLIRAHAQYKLLQSMEEQYSLMCDIVKENYL